LGNQNLLHIFGRCVGFNPVFYHVVRVQKFCKTKETISKPKQ
jgi:hypothetical protein